MTGSLGSRSSGTTYTQKITTAKIGSGNSAVTYTYTWSYAVTPSEGSYTPHTAWVLKSTQGDGTASVEIGGDVAGQSVLVKGGVRAVIAPVPFQLGVGQYLVQLTGTVKGNTATATSSAFQIQKTLNIVGVSCGSAAP